MSFPVLYDPNETDFQNNGIGVMSDCISCKVTEERNGLFELYMQYPLDGLHFSELQDRSIVKAKPNRIGNPQLFRVYNVTSPMNGVVGVSAQHISYDMSGIPVEPFEAQNIRGALDGLAANAIFDHPFTFATDRNTDVAFSFSVPASMRSRLGGSAGSILDVYGGEFEFDNFKTTLYAERGFDRGVSIRYGKNLTDLTQERNCASVYTAVYPYWLSQESNEIVTIPEKIVRADGQFSFERILMLDVSQSFETKPTEEQVRNYAVKYVKSNKIGVPKVSLSVSFAQLSGSVEYENKWLLEEVFLCDTVHVEFPALGVSATAKAVKVVYDVILERVDSVSLGDAKSKISDTIIEQQKEIEKKPSKTDMRVAVEKLTSRLLGANGGAVRYLDTNGDGMPDELYIANDPDPAMATKVWRFNYEGFGASDRGYLGPFELGMTFEDGIIADFITAGTLNADLIKAGTIRSTDGTVEIAINKNTVDLSVGSNLNVGNFSFFPRTNGNLSIRWVGA